MSDTTEHTRTRSKIHSASHLTCYMLLFSPLILSFLCILCRIQGDACVLAKHLRTVRNITKLIVHGESIGRVQDPLFSSLCLRLSVEICWLKWREDHSSEINMFVYCVCARVSIPHSPS
jgi:hypothetical protein